MAEEASRPYQYQPLVNDECIRLLKIHPGTIGEKVRAELRPAAFDEDYGCVEPNSKPNPKPSPKPPPADPSDSPVTKRDPALPKRVRVKLTYDAVSWAWGNPAKNAQIEIMDSKGDRWTFSISRKLEEALQAVRSENSVATIWIDAICINQNDDYEKSHQVPMMDRIYGLAQKVCVWLGPRSQTHDAGIAFKLLRQLSKDMDYRKTIKGSNVDHLRALSAMMRRDWFSRRWIIQEIALAKKAVVFCDKESMDWVEFAQAIELFVEGESRTQLADNATLRERWIPHYWKNVWALGAARLVRDISAIRRLAPDTHSHTSHELLMSLEEIVSRLETFKTSKPHDTIYAYLALAKDTVPVAHLPDQPSLATLLAQAAKGFNMTKIAAKSFIVDYKRPYAQVCSQFIQFAIKQQSNRQTALDILCRPWSYDEEDPKLRRDLGLPRWVSTIASAPFEMTTYDSTIGLYRRNGDPFVGPPGKPIYNASDSTTVDDKFLKFLKFPGLDGVPVHSLTVTGFILDSVAVIKSKVTCDAVVPEEWLTLGQWLDTKQPPPDSLWKTLVGDRGPNGTGCPLSFPLCCLEAIKSSLSLRNLETSTITSHPDRFESFVAGFCSRVQEVVVNRRLVMTKGAKNGSVERPGSLGLVSGREFDGVSIRQGDLICILHGCSVPVVLRRVRKTREQMAHEEKEYEKLLVEPVRMVERRWAEILEQRGWRRRAGAWLRRWFRRGVRWLVGWLEWVVLFVCFALEVVMAGGGGVEWVVRRFREQDCVDCVCANEPRQAAPGLMGPPTCAVGASSTYTHDRRQSEWIRSMVSRIVGRMPAVGGAHVGYCRLVFWVLLRALMVVIVFGLVRMLIFGWDIFILRRRNARVADELKKVDEDTLFKKYDRRYFYQFWGECYIDGMMDGYAVRVQNEANAEKSLKDKMLNMVFDLR